MDRKSLLVVVLSLGLIFLWQFVLVPKIYPPKPRPVASTNAMGVVTGAVATVTGSNVAALSAGQGTPSLPATPEGPEELLVLTNETSVFTFTSRGGGLKHVELLGYDATVDCSRAGVTNQSNGYAMLNNGAPQPAFALIGSGALESGGTWQMSRVGPGVRAEKALANGLVLIKEFLPSTNYLLLNRVAVENRGTAAVALPAHEYVIGTATPLSAHEPLLMMGTYWQNGDKPEHITESWFANRTLGCFPGTPRAEYRAEATSVKWAAVHNQFFAIAVIGDEPAAGFRSRQIELPPPSAEVRAADPRAILKPVGFESALTYAAAILEPGQTVDRRYTVFVGPKEYNTLAHLAKNTGTDVGKIMGFGWAPFAFFAKILLLSMNGVSSWGLSYGMAIIVVTIIIKVLFFPLTHASTKSMKRMALLQPEMTKLREKYKDDTAKMNAKMMEFMREHRINPIAGCVPILIQIPVFIGFYQMLNAAIELRGTSFLWACDLSQADTVGVVMGLPLNILPILWAVSTWWQVNLTPVSPGMDPAQARLMKYMPFMFFFILYNMAAGLTLYWTVQNLLGILQTKLTNPGADPAAAKKTAAIVQPKKKK